MGGWPSMGVATVSLMIGLVAGYFGRRSKASAVLVGCLVLVFFVLAFMFLVADSFTGRGIDQAVLYHVMYGLGGAGFSEYSRLMLIGTALLLFGATAAVACTLLLTRTRPPVRTLPTNRASVAFALLACALNPASIDLWQVAGLGSLGSFGSPGSAELATFRAHYRAPKLGGNPSARRNFIFIYAEGLERTYLDEGLFPGLITGIRELEKLATTFTNVSQTTGTSFTIGGIVGSQCGIPLVTSSGVNSMGRMSTFLPNAVCLGDLLRARGYHLAYLGGASSSFAGKGKFLSGHGFSEVRGREQLIESLPDRSYVSGWGIHDDTLLDLAYEKFIALSSHQKPFGLFMLTLDTHHPNGHVSRAVADLKYEDGDVPILNAVAGSDKLLTAFIRRVLASPEGKDTLIVLCSDHLAMKNGASDRLSQGERRNLFMIIDPVKPGAVRINKNGTTLDIGPTVLHALGYRASLGLGRDLLGDELSLNEELPDLRAALTDWKGPLASFWGFSRLKDIRIDAAAKTISAGGATVLAPVLMTFNEDLHVEVFFETNSRQMTLPDYIYRLPMGTAFVWVVDCGRAREYVSVAGAADELCAVSGRRGAAPIVGDRTGASMTIDEDQLVEVLRSRPLVAVHQEQTMRLREAELPNGLTMLLSALPSGSVFFHSPADRASAYIKDYAAQPEVALRGIVWTDSIPLNGEFYFASSSLKAVKKRRAYQVERLPLSDDVVALLEQHKGDVVVLSLRGDMKALSPRTIEYLSKLGIDAAAVDRQGSFAAVLDANVPVAIGADSKEAVVLSSPALRDRGIERVESAGRKLGDYSRIIINGKDASKNRRGLNFVILTRGGTQTSLSVDTHVTEHLPSDVYRAVPKL